MEPNDIPRLAAAAFCAAAVVLCGAGYALFLALGRARNRIGLRRAAWLAYGGVVLGAVGLSRSLHLDGLWLAVIGVLLVGYFVAPRAIWRLSVATHQKHQQKHQEGAP